MQKAQQQCSASVDAYDAKGREVECDYGDENILKTSLEKIPERIQMYGKKSLFNWMGVANGASQHPSVDRVLALKEDIQSAE
ncbi:hypothetical protein [Planococcus sp. ISL-110]|uniref:hypothetical protein n=1 Tax=Planococcus sp. ISL-110 TaxID=2819167 RepID=UPI001BEC17E6|nr:hypothetical protein [Planococcus sp. ISL-110]MBT2571095.1 hypothetical protein [Planococcus sp. ISL-110]